MSLFGVHATIDGVPCGPVSTATSASGTYHITFEREYASLEQIEGINWGKPEIVLTRNDCPLTPGCGYRLVRIQYDSCDRCFNAEVHMIEQYFGDITEYKRQVRELSGKVSELNSQLDEADETAISLYEALAAQSEGKEAQE